MTAGTEVCIHYHRPPDREEIFYQKTVLTRKEVIVTLAESITVDLPMTIEEQIVLETGSPIVWFTFPGAWHDIGSFHRADGTFTGFYANVITPVKIEENTWHTTDLYLDLWLSPSGDARLLDEDEFEEAVAQGCIDQPTAHRAREEAENLLDGARQGEWPPPIVKEWTLPQAQENTFV